MFFKMISTSALAGLVLVATSPSFARDGGGGFEHHYPRPKEYSRQKERDFQGDSATRTHPDGTTTTSRETYSGDREVTGRGSKHKSRWNDRPWATWTDSETGERGARAGGESRKPHRDSAARHHPDGTETTSRADGNGGRDVMGRDGNTTKSRWGNKAWATWTDTNTGETGSRGVPPGR